MKRKPNVLVFFTDQQRWDTLGLNGNPMGLTPNFDRLAREGTFFKNAVTPQPVCGPARSCLQTGQYATSTGVWCNGPGLKKNAQTLAKTFAKAGYRTGYIGKWHLSEGTGDGAVPKENRGGYEDWLAGNAIELISGPYSSVLFNEKDEKVSLPGYRVDAQTDAAIRYLEERSKEPEKPFLLFHSYLEPHHQNTDDSYPAPHGYAEKYRGQWLPDDLQTLGGSSGQHWAGYCGMIKRLDEALGRTMDALESLNLLENTIVAFISDHGCHFKTRNPEYKRTAHESSVRVPMAFWGPGWNSGGVRLNAASLVDFMPSLLHSAGVKIPKCVEGKSLFARKKRTGKHDDETLIQFGDSWLPPGRAIRTNRWKYIVTAPAEKGAVPASDVYEEQELYDLQADPYELTNLIEFARYEPVKKVLSNRLKSLIKSVEKMNPKIIRIKTDPAQATQRRIDYPG